VALAIISRQLNMPARPLGLILTQEKQNPGGPSQKERRALEVKVGRERSARID